jgi:hypothetical protein
VLASRPKKWHEHPLTPRRVLIEEHPHEPAPPKRSQNRAERIPLVDDLYPGRLAQARAQAPSARESSARATTVSG